MANEHIEFIRGVSRLHSFYTENVRMLAEAYQLDLKQAAMMLDNYGYHNVAREILRPQAQEDPAEENAARRF